MRWFSSESGQHCRVECADRCSGGCHVHDTVYETWIYGIVWASWPHLPRVSRRCLHRVRFEKSPRSFEFLGLVMGERHQETYLALRCLLGMRLTGAALEKAWPRNGSGESAWILDSALWTGLIGL